MNRKLFLKIAERVAWTFIQGTTSTLLLAGFLDTEAWKAAVVGGVAAVLALIKGYAATRVGDPMSPATLPATVTATGAVAGEVTGTVVSEAGEVIGEVVGVVGGTVDDLLGESDDDLVDPSDTVAGDSRMNEEGER